MVQTAAEDGIITVKRSPDETVAVSRVHQTIENCVSGSKHLEQPVTLVYQPFRIRIRQQTATPYVVLQLKFGNWEANLLASFLFFHYTGDTGSCCQGCCSPQHRFRFPRLLCRLVHEATRLPDASVLEQWVLAAFQCLNDRGKARKNDVSAPIICC